MLLSATDYADDDDADDDDDVVAVVVVVSCCCCQLNNSAASLARATFGLFDVRLTKCAAFFQPSSLQLGQIFSWSSC